MKNCPQCKYPNPDSRNDCFKCGVPLDGSAPVKEQPVETASTPQYTPPGPYSGPGQSPTGYQNPNLTYSTPIIMPVVDRTPVNRGLWTGLAVVFVCLMFWGIRAYMAHSVVAAMDKGTGEKNYTVISCAPQINALGMPTIAGQICNNSNKDVLLAQATIELYDANGKKVGTTIASTMNWLPNQNWDYEALVDNPAVASAKVVKVKMTSERQ